MKTVTRPTRFTLLTNVTQLPMVWQAVFTAHMITLFTLDQWRSFIWTPVRVTSRALTQITSF
jgi:hypothetical protein